MASHLQGLVYWGGITDFVGASMTYTAGVTPNVATITIPPQDASQIFAAGDLVWQFGDRSWTFRRCRLQAIRSRLTATGVVWELTILDRRWTWTECGVISGFYNARHGEKIKPGTEKTPRALARLCLDAMGESRYDVSALPDNARPEIDWDAVLPGEALAQLCDSLGCLVVLGLNDRVRICRKYQGYGLPVADLQQGDLAMRPPDPPGKIACLCGRTRFQAELPLEAVGQDIDGAIKPIDELSYKPRTGWGNADIYEFTGMEDATARKLAQQSVFRWYRVKTPFTLPGWQEKIADVKRVLPLEQTQVELWEKDGRQVKRPAWVYGEFWDGDESAQKTINIDNHTANLRKKSDAIWQHGMQLDGETGIVRLSEPCYLLERTTETTKSAGVARQINKRAIEPKIWLRTAVSLRHGTEWGWLRQAFYRRFSGQSAARDKVRYYRHDDIVQEIYMAFERAAPRLTDNRREIEQQANYYLNSHAIEYNPEQSATIGYAGLKPIQVDGAIWQVSWSISGGVSTTQATRNREELSLSISYDEKRFLARVAQDQVDRNKPQRQRDDDALKRKAPS